MPSVTLGRKRPSEAIVESGTKPKKLKFTDDGEAVVVSSTPSKVKPDYSRLTKKDKKEHKSHQDNLVYDVSSSGKGPSVAKSSLALSEEIDFPRGGGSSLTPLELKETRAEGIREADSQIFKDSNTQTSASRKRLRSGKLKEGVHSKPLGASGVPRIEYLTYKKLQPGMRVLAQVIGITPLSAIVSLPHQLLGYIPIDKISSDLNIAMDKLMEKDANTSEGSESENGEGEEEDTEHAIPTLEEIFHPGQYVRAIVTTVHPQGINLAPSDNSEAAINLGKPRNELERASRRVELSLLPEQVNKGITGKDLVKDFTLPVSISSVEDHGYTLNLGVTDISGFLSFKDSAEDTDRLTRSSRLKVGTTLIASVKKMEENGRMCPFIAGEKIAKCELSSLTSISAVHPGSLVQALVTTASSKGVNVQILGVFNGTVHPLHASKDPATYSIGKKIKTRILWDIPGTEPRQFALSTLDHIQHLKSKFYPEPSPDDEMEDHEAAQSPSLDQQFPIGTTLDAVKVTNVDTDRGLTLSVTDTINGIVHISEVSDDHVPSLSATSGPYKVGSIHRARVTGYHYLDGTLQCSMKDSILEQKWLRVDDVKVGEIVKGTIVNLTDRGLFVSISGSVHAVIWPNHYADIRLKHPERKFKAGKTVKCKVLVVNPERNRVCLTAKKTLIESSLPIIASLGDAKLGNLAHAVIFKVGERTLSLEFYNGIKGIVPLKEASEISPQSLEGLFTIGQVVKVRILDVKEDKNLVIASIIKATGPDIESMNLSISKIDIGSTVSGALTAVHKDQLVLKLEPSSVPALLSLNNLANYRGVSLEELRKKLEVGENLEELVVVSRNPSKGIVIVATKPKAVNKLPATSASLSLESLKVGQKIPGLVVKHTKRGATVRLAKHLFGALHPTDVSDDYDSTSPLPSLDSVVHATIIAVDLTRRQVTLSTRPSRGTGSKEATIRDPEINDIESLKTGQYVRGFVKEIAESGLFVSLSRNLDARIQIKELFDQFIQDWKAQFRVNQVVQGRILSIKKDKSQVEMTLRSGDLSEAMSSLSLSDFSSGQRVDGVIKKIEEYGVFVQIKGTKISGLCHKSELSDPSGIGSSEVLRSLKTGDHVRALILSINTETKKIAFSLKPSHFFDEDLQDDEMAQGKDENGDEMHVDQDRTSDSSSDGDAQSDGDTRDDEMIAPPDMNRGDPLPWHEGLVSDEVSPLQLSFPLRWNTATTQETEDEQSEDLSSDDEEPMRKRKKKKHEIQYDQTVDLQNRAPQSTSDFERMLLGAPNSSYLWIQFMAFQLQISEVEKAREIGRRALKAINFREEQERLNVWIALLNLEVAYGTEQSLDSVFKEAARANDSKTIHWRLAVLLDDAKKHERAEEQFQKTCKKFGKSSKVWTLFAEHYFKMSQPEAARHLLHRCLLSLEKRKHLKTISKFGQLEYKLGDPERGRTIFEGIVDTHSKRLDLWNVYIDMEAGKGDIERVRGICERAVALKLSKKKAKCVIPKY
ncbi:hypothetical protein CPB86DRAFT_43532 [Serendipita vermifera]|nr:hypothetical protein CPB86DRAFT_43532 [Serendipita vermifera]